MSSSGSPPSDTALALLSSQTRRHLLSELIGRQLPVAIEQLAPPADVSSRQTFLLSTHHTHLPKLEHAGLLTYDAETRTVETVSRERIALALDASIASLETLRRQIE